MTATVRRRAVASVAVVIPMMMGVAAAGAEEPAATGWWWAGRPSAAIPVLLAPVPAVPDGGLYVAGDATGPTGMSALRVELAPGASATTIRLTIAEAVGTPIIDACAAADAWEPAENGGWDERPAPDCEALSIAATIEPDGAEVTFSLAARPDPGTVLDLVLVPGVDPETERPAIFSVAFEPPGAEAVAMTGREADASEPGSASTAPDRWSGPASPSFAAPDAPSLPASSIEARSAPETFAPRSRPASITGPLPGAEGFAYPVVLVLPLVLLVGGSYLAWTLTRPIVVRGGRRERAVA